MKKAVYAGSFDPFTLGHLDVVDQALRVFDEIIIAIGHNPAKSKRVFGLHEAVEIIESYFEPRDLERLTITSFGGALVHFAEATGCDAILRGLRQVSDFDSEFKLHGVNSRAAPTVPMVYLICNSQYLHVASSTAREMATIGLDTSWLLNPYAKEALDRKLNPAYKTLPCTCGHCTECYGGRPS